jgi:purine-binding chemotaxis protein CheW
VYPANGATEMSTDKRKTGLVELSGPEAVDGRDRDAILKERASRFAAPRRADAGKSRAAADVVRFSIAGEDYAIESAYVSEVFRFTDLTPVPCTPSFITGVINVRGRVVALIDLRVFFDVPPQGLSDRSRAVILSDDNTEFGILIDTIRGAGGIVLDDLLKSLPTLTGVREQYLKGVTADNVVLLDGAKLLSDPRLIVEETVGE